MKKILIGIAAAFVLIFGVTTAAIVRADNNHENENHNNGNSNSHREDEQENEARSVGSSFEMHITNNGKVLVRGAKVSAVNGNTITAGMTWGSLTMNWSVVTDGNTKYIRRFGGTSGVSEITIGDFISFQGMLDSGTASPITVKATAVKDWSIQKKNGTFEGTVSSVDATGMSFVLASHERGNITVKTTSSTEIKKGSTAGVFADILVNSEVSATGLFNNESRILDASSVKIKTPGTVTTTKEGKLVSIAGTSAPTTFVLLSGDTNYTVNVGTTTSILNNMWLATPLSGFVASQNVRVYGSVNMTDHTIDATVVRNTSL